MLYGYFLGKIVKLTAYFMLTVVSAQILFTQEITVSHTSGFYDRPFDLSVISDGYDEIYYTLDGKTSDTFSNRYTKPLFISNELVITNNTAFIPSTAIPNISGSEVYYTWQEPSEYPKAIAVSCRGFKSGNHATETMHQTYFINSPEFDLPVLSFIIDPSGLFDEDTGIYVPGIRCDTTNSIWTGNYHMRGKPWERKAYLQFFSNRKLCFEQYVGLRIHGVKTRSAPQKSLRIYARKKYGESYVDFQLFKSDYKRVKRFIVQTPFNAHRSNLIADLVIHELCRPLNVEIMDYNPCVVFINGEYWGLHFIRERLDEYYINNHYNINTDSVLIRDNSIKDFRKTAEDILKNDLSNDQYYKEVQELIDIPCFMDYIIAETYFRNLDWMINNEGYWRASHKSRWRFVLFDLDAGFQRHKKNMFTYIEGKDDSPVAGLFKALIKNEEFKSDFIQRYAYVVNNHFSPKKAFSAINNISNSIDSEISRHINRWGFPDSKYKWYKSVDYLKKFANWRAMYVDRHLKEYLNINETGIKTFRKRIFFNTDLRRGLIPGLIILLIAAYFIYYQGFGKHKYGQD